MLASAEARYARESRSHSLSRGSVTAQIKPRQRPLAPQEFVMEQASGGGGGGGGVGGGGGGGGGDRSWSSLRASVGGAPLTPVVAAPPSGSVAIRAAIEKLTSTVHVKLLRRMEEESGCPPPALEVDARLDVLRREGAAESDPSFLKKFVTEWRALDASLRVAEQAEADAGGAARLAALNAQSAA